MRTVLQRRSKKKGKSFKVVVDSGTSKLEIYVNVINIIKSTFKIIIWFSVIHITLAEYLIP